VLTQEVEQARSVICTGNATLQNPNAKNAAAADIGDCQDRRKALCQSTFRTSPMMRIMCE
jgi:hypothetical protein